MYKFFINRPIVAMVIAILMVIIGAVSMVSLPVAQFPNIVPPEIRIQTTFLGGDAQTLAQSVATPIEEQMSGVDNMNYMYSVSANNGVMRMGVNFDVKTDPNIDQMLAQLRENQAASQLPPSVQQYGVTLLKSPSSPMMLIALSSPKGTHDATFLANYAYINLVDQITQLKGISNINVFGAGQYAMRFWVKPDQLAKLNLTVNDIITAINAQNNVNPAGQVGGPPTPHGQEFTYAITAQGRLVSEKEFGEIIIRENPDGSIVRLKDVARVELGAQLYNIVGKLNGKPSAILAIYQLPDSNALDDEKAVLKLMAKLKQSFPADLDYAVSLDTTLAVSEGMHDIMRTLVIALILVILVVFIFLQGWRASLIPLLAVPVSLIGTFAFFPIFGFSLNTLSLFGLVLAIGLVVDDAIVVVEATERHIEEGMTPKDAALKAMQEVAGPVVSLALILAAVFIPTIFIAGITGRLYQQFALTIVISVMLSAFNALSLSPALAAMLLKPKEKNESRGPLGKFYDWFNRVFDKARNGYLKVAGTLIRKIVFTVIMLVTILTVALLLGARLPTAFLPEEDQGYALRRRAIALRRVARTHRRRLQKDRGHFEKHAGRKILHDRRRLQFVEPGAGHLQRLLFRDPQAVERTDKIRRTNSRRFERTSTPNWPNCPKRTASAFPPPSIPGVGTSGGFTFILEDRSGSQDSSFLTQNLDKFMAAARKRPELAGLLTTYLPNVPQVFVKVDRDKVLKLGVPLNDVYTTLQTFMGGYFVNYFNRFGRQWQVYLEAEDQYRTRAENLLQFYVRNNQGQPVPLSAFTEIQHRTGPEFVMHYNEYPCAQINGAAAPGYSDGQATKALEEVFAQTMPPGMGHDYFGMSFQEQQAAAGVSPALIFSAFSPVRFSDSRRAI